MRLFKWLPICCLLVCVVFLTVGYSARTSAAPPSSCEPWPGCKDEGAGDPPGLSTCNAKLASIPGTCWDLDGGECEITRAQDNTPGWFLTEDCKASATLVVPYSDPIFGGRDFTLYLVAPWLGGRAAIVNQGARARVANLSIVVENSSIADGTCTGTAGKIETAVSLDPHIAGYESGGPRMASAALTISARNGARFCNGIEYASYDGAPNEIPMIVGGISGNTIEEDSYSMYGVVADSINATDNITGDSDVVTIGDNTIRYSSTGCAGIKIDTVERVAVTNNTVFAPGGCIGAVGIDIENAGVGGPANPLFFAPEPIEIKGNVVVTNEAATVGVSIQSSAVEKNEGNILTGEPSDTAYFTCDSGVVPFPTNGKKQNTFNGTTIENSTDCGP